MILIDDRAGSRDLIKYAPLNSHKVAELCRLDSGDICFVGNGPRGESCTGIELKSILDLVSSRQSGRLQGVDGQVPEMLTGYDERWLLTYGTYRCGDDGSLELPRKIRGKTVWQPYSFGSGRNRNIPFAYLESTLVSLSDIGIRHHHVYGRTDDLSQAARWIYVLYLKRQKSWKDQCKMFRAYNNAAQLTESVYKRVISGLETDSDICPMPGDVTDPIEYQIAKTAASLLGKSSYERSVAAGRHFDSVLSMVQAPEKEWEKVDGIGKVLGRAVVQKIRQKKKR